MEKLIFMSMNHALRAKRILESNSYKNIIVKKCHTPNGCGFCIEIPLEKAAEIKNILKITR